MLAEYVYLGDQLLAMIKPEELAYYFHNDHLGTPQVLTDDAQAIAWKAVYTPFGEAVASIEIVENPFRFPGQYYDQETGLHYNYFRYYDPTTGRYVTPDPIGLEGGINLFSYVAGNPLRWGDPFGLQIGPPPVPVPGGVPGNGWKWNPNPSNPRGGTWGPKTPVPGQSQPTGSWDPEGHWDIDNGLGKRDRYDENGNSITPEEAHKPKKKGCEDQDNTTKIVVVGAGAVVTGYLIYRGIRMLPSLLPPLWWTIPANAAIP
jgi:RHS repeat-associated protein